MKDSVTIIFPHQLFQNHPALQKCQVVYLVEEWLFYRQYNFHKQKLVLHRASMKFYENWLRQNEYCINYVETGVRENDCRQLVASVYNGDDGPAKTEDMGPVVTGIVGPLSICKYKD